MASDSFHNGDSTTTATRSSTSSSFQVCKKCKGEGKIIQPASRKARKRSKLSLDNTNNNPQQQQQQQQNPPPPPRIDGCKVCQGSGLMEKKLEDDIITDNNVANSSFPHVAIIGGGIGGLALAVACQHRSIPFTVYERDFDFFQRSQGYGLTMQQASRSLASLGIPVPLPEGIVSTKHMVHTPEGRVVGEWGMRKWLSAEEQKKKSEDNHDKAKTNKNKRQNVHIARQSLRYELLKALGGPSEVQWGHKLVNFVEYDDRVDLTFEVQQSKGDDSKSTQIQTSTKLLVGADGIRSSVRNQWLGEETTPLRYLGCIVILGICPLSPTELTSMNSPLLDGETVFQTADGSTRIYMMPYSKKEYMWQLSFPMSEIEAKELSRQGPQALKAESLKRCSLWHDPITPILQRTPVDLVSGYPVYDRDLLTKEMLQTSSSSESKARRITLVGDAGHPMSPFKGKPPPKKVEVYFCLP